MINKDRLIETFFNLVKIDSPSGEEKEIGEYLIKHLQQLGFKVKHDNYENVIASNSDSSNPFLLSAHMDTVEPGRGIQPHIDNGRIISDATTILGGDCKAGMSAILEAITTAKEQKITTVPLQIVLTREEEVGLRGARNLDYSLINAKQAIIFDGNGSVEKIHMASPTYVSIDIEITGKAAHAGGEPEKGISAIRIAAEIITNLKQGRIDHETTINIGKINGGLIRNGVPEKTTIIGEFRSRNLETLELTHRHVTDTINKVKMNNPKAIIDDKIHVESEGYSLNEENSLVKFAKNHIKTIGLTPVNEYSGGCTDANIFNKNGIQSVVVGMGTYDMHTKKEYVIIDELMNTSKFCLSTIMKE